MAAKPNAPPEAEESPSRSSLILVIKGLLLMCALQFFVLAYFVYEKKTRPAEPESRPVVGITTRAGSEAGTKCQPGPWGDLEYVRINLVPPEDQLQVQVEDLPATEWQFAGYNSERLAALFQGARLTPEQQAALLDTGRWLHLPDKIVVRPREDLVLGLSAESRQTIYSVLAENPANHYQHFPYTFRKGGFEEPFENSGVSARSQALIRSLTYQRGAAVCFSDLREVLARTPKEAERNAIVRALARRPGVLVKLRVQPGRKLEETKAYWSKGGRAKDISALLDSLSRVPGGPTIDIAHLLPAFARSRLNTFPAPPARPDEPQPDCYWTAINFSKERPAPYHSPDTDWRHELMENYTETEKPVFGDLVFLVQSDGVPHHAAVFIADDIVFTKNGGNQRQPWLLMKVEDMRALYPGPEALRLVLFTPKNRPN